MRSFSTLDLRYGAARLLNMAVRPATISAAAFFFGTVSAQQVSIVIFSVSIAMLLMAIDPYRAYYKKHFNDRNSGEEFVVYIIIITTWMSFVGALTFIVMWLQHVPVFMCVLSVIMFVGEKFADEILRFHLFKKSMATWSNLVIQRSGIQLLGLLIAVLFHKFEYSFSLLLVSFSLSWVFSFYRPMAHMASIVAKNLAVFQRNKFYRKAGSRITSSAFLMASSLMSSSPSFFDKIVTVFADRASLPLFLVASMSFSLIQNFVDFFFVSKIRLELLKHDTNLSRLLLSRKLFYCIAMGAVGGAAIMAIQAPFLDKIFDFDLVVLMLAASINIILAMTTIPQQIVYWRDGPPGILIAELGFYLPLLILYLCSAGMQWTLAIALTFVAISLATRFISYILVCKHGAIVSALPPIGGRRNRNGIY